MYSIIIFRFKYLIFLTIQRFRPYRFFAKKDLDATRQKAFIFLSADYGNLGDIALMYAQKCFLEEYTNYQIIEIPVSRSTEGLWFVRRNIKKGDLVTITGGGNMGDYYFYLEFIRQLVIRFFPNNRIISFPQTIYFSDTLLGRKELARAQKIYNKHGNLYLFARDYTSYQTMRDKFPKTHVFYTPDIVLYLNCVAPKKKREGVIICMRSDIEKKVTDEQYKSIIGIVEKLFDKVEYYDTHIKRNPLLSERFEILFDLFDKFKGAELVVTDRLHGMIFSQITDTPCLVFSNFNHKVVESHEWIKDNKGILMMTEFSENLIKEFLDNHNFKASSYIDLKDKYKPLSSLFDANI